MLIFYTNPQSCGRIARWAMQYGTIPPSAALTGYWTRLKDRPTLQVANTKDNALIPETRP